MYNLALLQTKGYTNEHQGNTKKNDIMLCADNQRLCSGWEVVQLNESNRKGKLSRWRKDALKKKDRERKKKEKRRKERPHGGVARKNNKGVAICSMMRAAKPNHPTKKKDAMRN